MTSIRIVVSTDERYAMPTAAAVRSIIDTRAPGETLDVAVLASDLSEHTRRRLRRSWNAPGCTVTFTPVDLARFAGLPTTSAVGAQVTTGVYARLLLGELLPPGWDRVIYLDCDTITQHSLADLWTTDLHGRLLGAVRDDYVPTLASPYGLPTWQRDGLDPALSYFNSGVLLIDLDAWRREHVGEHAIAYLLTHRDDIRLFDQDALNAVAAGRWWQLDTVWNVTGYWRKPQRRTGAHRDILTTARIRHFAGPGKPWQPEPLDVDDGHLFFDSLARTDWATHQHQVPAAGRESTCAGVTAVLIDAGRVLIHPDDTLFQHAARAHQQPLAAGVAVRAIGRTVWEGATSADPVAFWNSDRKVDVWARHAGLNPCAGARIWQHVHQSDTVTPLWSIAEPTAATALAVLAAAGCRIGVVSNNDGRLRQQLDTAGLTPYVTAIVDSAVLGIAKPDPAIFLHAAATLGARPDQCVMIGDDPHFDIHASTRAGIGSTILIDAHHDRPATWPTPACRDLGAATVLLLAEEGRRRS